MHIVIRGATTRRHIDVYEHHRRPGSTPTRDIGTRVEEMPSSSITPTRMRGSQRHRPSRHSGWRCRRRQKETTAVDLRSWNCRERSSARSLMIVSMWLMPATWRSRRRPRKVRQLEEESVLGEGGSAGLAAQVKKMMKRLECRTGRSSPVAVCNTQTAGDALKMESRPDVGINLASQPCGGGQERTITIMGNDGGFRRERAVSTGSLRGIQPHGVAYENQNTQCDAGASAMSGCKMPIVMGVARARTMSTRTLWRRRGEVGARRRTIW